MAGDARAPGGGEGDRRARVLLSVLEDLREERERLAHQTEQRRLAEQRFRATIEAAPTAMVMIDADGRITLVNAQTEALFGYPRHELLGEAVEILLPEELRGAHPSLRDAYFRAPLARAMGEGRDLFGRRRDGSRVPVEIGLSPVVTDEGTFVLSTIVDISERKRVAEAQRLLNVELERRVEERTAELEIARDVAQAANRAKSHFLANMSHEIRTPLNAVIALSEVLSQSSLDARQRDLIDTVMGSAESLLGVIDDILDFSKIEAGKLTLESVSFDLHDLIDATLKAMAPRAAQAGIELGLFVDPALPFERVGDPGRLRQVLSNLLNNAIKFTPAGEVELRVEPEDGGGAARVRFSVRDTGVGIDEPQRARLFDPFEQADSSTTRRFGGTGLGLSICRQLVQLMDGEIGVESEPGVGSCFHFSVPLPAGTSRITPPPELAGRRIVLASPGATLRRNFAALLRAWGLEVDVAGTPRPTRAALGAAAGAKRSWLLLDAALGVDESWLRELHRDPDQAPAGIVLLGTLGALPDAESARRQGITATVARPIAQRDLLRALLGGEGAAAADAAGSADRTEGPGVLSGLRVLLAEDSGANRKVAQALLGEHVGRLDFVENGSDALAALHARPYDLVLMDVQMPDMDGLEATARIRSTAAPELRHLPIIAMTAHALQGDRERCLDAGMDDYVSKPVRRDELFAAIGRVMRGSGKAQGPALEDPGSTSA